MAHFVAQSPVFICDYDAEFCDFVTPTKAPQHLYPCAFTFDQPAEGEVVPAPRCRRCVTVIYFVLLAVVACFVGYQLGSSMFDLIVPAIGSVDETDVVQLGSDGQPIVIDPLQNWSKVHAMDGVEIVVGAPVMFGDESRAQRSNDASEAYLMYEISDMLQTVQIVAHLWDAAIAAAASNQQLEGVPVDADSILQRMGGAPFKMAALQGSEGEWIELTSTFTLLDTTPNGWAMGAFVVEDIPPCAMFKVIFNDMITAQSRSAWRPQLAEVQMVFDQTSSA